MSKNKNKTPEETTEQTLIRTIRAIADNDDIEVLFGHQPRVSGNIVFLPKPQGQKNEKNRAEMRGLADGQAFRFVFHNAKTHNKLTPSETEARELFDCAEQVRVEACGANLLDGARHNLNAAWQKKAADLTPPENNDALSAEALGAVLWEKLNNMKLSSPILQLWRTRLEKQVGPILDQLNETQTNQATFAKKIQQLLKELGLTEAAPENAEQNNEEELSQDEEQETQQEQDDGDASADSAQADMEESDDELSEGEEQMEAQNADQDDIEGEMDDGEQPVFIPTESSYAQKIVAYKIFTQAFDEIAYAENLAPVEELQRLRQTLDKQLNSLHGLVARLANRLQRHLMARHSFDWEYDLDEGWLDPSRLSRVITSPLSPLTYRQTRETELRDTVVTLLLDNSGSMRGRPITVAALCADIFARTLERCGVKVEILGFTTKKWKGGQAREAWLKADRPLNPGRLNDIYHIIYKSADTPWRRARRNLGLMMREGLLKENIDGEALLWAHQRLLVRSEERKILMVISDGAPVDDATLSANNSNYLEKHLRAVIGEIESHSPIELLAIGIGHDVTRYYKRAVTILDAEQLGDAMISEFVALFDRNASWQSDHPRAAVRARRRFDAIKSEAKKLDREAGAGAPKLT